LAPYGDPKKFLNKFRKFLGHNYQKP